ncbi:hypothetical protein [Dactylosporangium sp. CA-233914]|uniref:hypothetical protein n=1 Tax=Dactylosporangium sp. CA-233914 TaxID=3239934 RepID=UPI003D8B8BAA
MIKGVSGFSWHGGGVYQAGGTGQVSGGIQIAGTANGLQSTNAIIDIETCRCLNLSNTLGANLRFGSIATDGIPGSGYSVANEGSAANIALHACYLAGPVMGNWTNSGVCRPTGWSAT